MKKTIIFLTVLFIMISGCMSAFASDGSKITINGQTTSIAPEMGSITMVNERNFVPVRFILEYLNYQVNWVDGDMLVFGQNDKGQMFVLQVDNNKITYNMDGSDDFKSLEMDCAPFMNADEGRVYIPIRYLAQVIGYNVGYDEATDTVTLSK